MSSAVLCFCCILLLGSFSVEKGNLVCNGVVVVAQGRHSSYIKGYLNAFQVQECLKFKFPV